MDSAIPQLVHSLELQLARALLLGFLVLLALLQGACGIKAQSS